MESTWDTVGYVISSKYRLSVVRELSDGSTTPTTLASSVAASTTHVSRALRQLRDRNLVTLAVPEDRVRDRRYELTNRGETVESMIEETDLAVDH